MPIAGSLEPRLRMTASLTSSILNWRQRIAAFLLLTGLLLTVVAYHPGTGGSLHFDDPHNLGGLSQVTDLPSAVAFIADGAAGPLGRPLALASFAPQAYAWPGATEVLLRTNVLLHALNGALVIWLLYLLGRARGRDAGDASVEGVAGGTVWMLLPLLASSSLMIVQRMTLLSATFTLIGVIGYLYGRSCIDRRPIVGLAAMSASLILATALAVLAKENGALLPLYVLAIELTLLSRPTRLPTGIWKAWFAGFLLLPAAILAALILSSLIYTEEALLRRDFNALERLLTQAHVLWQYVHAAFIPNPAGLGPFHDAQPVHHNWMAPSSLLAVAGWLATITAAVALRRRAPLFAFAVAWYLIGHALESSTIPLELYFEHRNYLPIAGPVYALCAGALGAAHRWRRIARIALVAYACVLAVTLGSFTSLWGNPNLAAEMWAIYNPASQRAQQHLASKLQAQGDHHTALRVLELYAHDNAPAHGVQLQAFSVSCVLNPDKDVTEAVYEMERGLANSRFQHGVVEALARLYELSSSEPCHNLNNEAIYRLGAAVAGNPAFQAHPVVRHNVHALLAHVAIDRRDLQLTMHHMEQALSSRFSIPTLRVVTRILASAGLESLALEFIEKAAQHRPANPLRAMIWDTQLADVRAVLSEQAPPNHP